MRFFDIGAADSIYVNGKIVTVDSADSIHSALAVKNATVMAVGSDSEVRELTGKATEVIDLAKKTVLPGINDSHIHAATYGATKPPFELDVGFPAVRSIADIKEAVRNRVASAQPGQWIHGSGWDYGYLDECRIDPSRNLTRWDLDEVAPGNPTFLVDFSRHRLVANSKALELAGITKDTTTQPGSL